MSTPINLNKARKAKARTLKKTRADENAVRFGRTKAQKTLDRTCAEKAARDLDGKARE
ncbi:MAG TPA: DUF4169 domain-containing protein [Rhodobacteraceae bacterium]|jgi:hypothetical protein|nr:DUF4169 domain-containing protein [Paracoccaceae bacterium]